MPDPLAIIFFVNGFSFFVFAFYLYRYLKSRTDA